MEIPELTDAQLREMRPLQELDPELAAWSLKRQRAKKGEPIKQSVHIRLSPEVVDFFKAKGPGWQTRIDKALKAFVEATR